MRINSLYTHLPVPDSAYASFSLFLIPFLSEAYTHAYYFTNTPPRIHINLQIYWVDIWINRWADVAARMGRRVDTRMGRHTDTKMDRHIDTRMSIHTPYTDEQPTSPFSFTSLPTPSRPELSALSSSSSYLSLPSFSIYTTSHPSTVHASPPKPHPSSTLHPPSPVRAPPQ